jgi:hypothetical protein
MDNRDRMYTGFASKSDEWIRGWEHFVNEAFDPAIAKGSKWISCPCSDCKNSKRKLPREMWKDIHNTAAYEKMSAYATAARTRHGDDFDLTTKPLYMDLLMRTGGGKQHGRYMIAHSAINPATVPTLREVRQGSSTTSDVPILPRQPSSVQQMAAMQTAFQVTTVLSVVHWFYICTSPFALFNHRGVILQS